MNNNPLKRRRTLRLITLVLLLILVCVGVSFVIANWVMRGSEWRHDQPHGHQWLQNELGLTEEETEHINAFEANYRAQRQALMDEFNEQKAQLADLLRTSDSHSDEVANAVLELHQVHGKLQSLSIEHYYEMLSVLPPQKQAKLRDLAVEALSTPQ